MEVCWEQTVTVATGDSYLSSHIRQPAEVRDMDYNANRWHSPFLGFVNIQDPVYYTCVLILKVQGASSWATLSAGRKRNSKGADAQQRHLSPGGAGCGHSRRLSFCSRPRGTAHFHFQPHSPMDASPFVNITFITWGNDHTVTQCYVPATSDWNKLA